MNDDERKGAEGRLKSLWKPVVLLAAVIAVIVLARMLGLGGKLAALRSWMESAGRWGPVVFIVLYVAATVAALPGSVLTVAAGALFGSVLGVILVSAASTLGASLAFLVARHFARASVDQWLGASDRFRRLDALTEEHGYMIVAITRLVPIFPFNFLNYAFGLTRVKFTTYVFWSWLCMLPGTIVYVAGTDAVTTAIAERRVPWVLVAAVAAVIVILTLLVRQARRRLAGGPSDEGEPPVIAKGGAVE
ncbi:MAG: TVP38/TMEM64 family protein [Planctomycetota bacterium]